MSARVATAEPEEGEGGGAPGRFIDHLWNGLAGLSLVPIVWIFSCALYRTLALAAKLPGGKHFWMSHEIVMTGVGAGLWLMIFFITLAIWEQPRPLRAYVLGHELMHMLVARLFLGRIKDYFIGREGGYIVTNKYNFLIALAPYLWPFYSVPVLAVWTVSLYWNGAHFYREWFLIAIGFTWMFHLSFTVWVLRRGQSDLHGPGLFFSLLFIYLVNTILLGSALVIIAPNVTWHGYAGELWKSTTDFYLFCGEAFGHAIEFLGGTLRSQAG
jgi:hypothetical protein